MAKWRCVLGGWDVRSAADTGSSSVRIPTIFANGYWESSLQRGLHGTRGQGWRAELSRTVQCSVHVEPSLVGSMCLDNGPGKVVSKKVAIHRFGMDYWNLRVRGLNGAPGDVYMLGRLLALF